MTNVAPLFGRAYQILSDRQRWEDKQRLYYKMRHDGIRRRNKPFDTAADLHFALIDEAINDVKPLMLAQALGSDKLAQFVSLRQQLQETTQSATDFFDFEVKHRTNFEDKLETVCDTALLRGRGIFKVYVDPFEDYRIVFEPVDPLMILMTNTVNDFDDADEFVHVRQVSVSKFKADRRYLARDRFTELRGGKDAGDRFRKQADQLARLEGDYDINFTEIFQDKELREGYTHSPKADTIIIWEHYIRTEGGYTVYSYAPIALDVELRKPYGVPYKVGGKVSLGFFSFTAETKDEGWYSPRGLAEKMAADEMFGCKLWNEWADSITMLNRPVFTSETPIQNSANLRWQAGEYIPGNIRAVQMGQPAISYGEQMQFVRGEAAAKTRMPQSTAGQVQQPGHKETATKTKRVASLENANWNHSAGNFKRSMCKMFKHVWGLMLQYKRSQLTYFISEDLKTLPEQALHDEYLIIPGGSTDDWDKTARQQRAMGRLEALSGRPNVNQDELVKDVLASDDARLVKRLLLPSNQKASSEAEDENQEITSMIVTHFPAPVKPDEDHVTRIKIILMFLHAQGVKTVPVDPMARQRIQEHLMMHLKILKEQQPQAYKQVVAMIQKMERTPMPTAGTGMGQLPPAQTRPAMAQQPQPAGGMRMI